MNDFILILFNCARNILRAQEDVNTIFSPKQKKLLFLFFCQYHEKALHGFYANMLRNKQNK